MKKGIISILVVLFILGAILASWLSGRTHWNDDSAVGNSSGNLMNGGLFCTYDNKIYFSNPNDDGALYSMNMNCTEFKKIHNDKVSYINGAGHYLVYVRDNHARTNSSGQFLNLNSVGIYRIHLDGSDVTQLYDDPAGITALKGNYIYYQHYNRTNNLEFYKVKLDGSEETKLSEEPVAPVCFINDTLYYNGIDQDHSIHLLNLKNDLTEGLISGSYYHVIAFENILYYIDLNDGYKIYKMNPDGSNPTLLVDERCSFFNVSTSGTYLYYQTDAGENNRLCKMNLETLEQKTLMEGDFNSIHTTDNYVFVKDFYSNLTYMIRTSDDSVQVFDPPVHEIDS